MEASCSSRIHVEAELELAFSERPVSALSDDALPVDRPVAGYREKRKIENATTDAGRNIPGRRQLVKPTPMTDYVCPQAKPASMPDFGRPEARHLLNNMTLLQRVEGVLQQAHDTSMTAEVLHQRLVAVVNQEKAIPTVVPFGASSDDALREVGKDGGACNWTLIDADGFKLHGAGRGGIEEMTSHLAHDKVLFGVLRLSFSVSNQHLKKVAQGFSVFGASDGSNRSKYVAHVFLHWVGPAVSAVRRGLFNAKCPKAVAMAEKHCSLAVQRRANCIKDVSIDNIVNDLKQTKALGAADCSGLKGGISALEY
mmetsp:Transcript_34480/g.68056  ORF Transcript_34480/g.68056 Transcript_34480/m.68056 type:complete len:311 (+) Transcript_34480:74-1006(+)